MTNPNPYDELVAEWRAQAKRRRTGTEAGAACATVFDACAKQLKTIAAHDREHAAIWRQRWEIASGAAEPVNLRELTDPELALQYAALQSHRFAIFNREQLLEAELTACENEFSRREQGAR